MVGSRKPAAECGAKVQVEKEKKEMVKYVVKRILITIPILIGVVFLIFVMLSVVPGDPVTVMMG